MSLFRATSSSTFTMSDVLSICILSVQDWYLEVKVRAKDRQCSFCLWIPWTKTIRILTRLTWRHRVLQKTCIQHGRNSKTRYIGPTSTWLWRKVSNSIKKDRKRSFFTKHFQLIVSRKLLGWKTGEVMNENLCVTSASSKDLLETWLEERFGFRSCSTTRCRSWTTIQKVPNQAYQIQSDIMKERRNPLFAATQITRKVQENVPFPGDRNKFFSWRSCQTW